MSNVYTNLSATECADLQMALDLLSFGDAQGELGVSEVVARTAARGERILITTAVILRAALGCPNE
jgi:bifunctional N-acetylglucosamine-1-phosphate-uridyltransferase/glucosamine-1-phosphate-acetyltransferase GlmU-like protein